MLAGENDIALLRSGGEGRSINRHNFTLEEIDAAVKKPVVQKLLKLMQFRNDYTVFDGEFSAKLVGGEGSIRMTWVDGMLRASLDADFKSLTFHITYADTDTGVDRVLEL